MLNKKKNIFISSYNPHFRFSNAYLVYLDRYLNSLKLNSNVTLIGDLNMDLLSSNGDRLTSLMDNYNLCSFQNNPTHFNKNSSTCLDVVFSNSKKLIDSVETFSCQYSDHNFVAISLNLEP
jgi:hypothetical protein